jgi:hypothetical protein
VSLAAISIGASGNFEGSLYSTDGAISVGAKGSLKWKGSKTI